MEKSSEKLTQHFSVVEFNKHGFPWSNYLNCNYRHIAVFLEMVRMTFRKPIIITSGYRTTDYNRRIGGVPNSYHTFGKAVDITCDARYDIRDLYFAVVKHFPPEAKFYYEYHPQKRYIHLQWGERDTSPLNLIQYFPFQTLTYKESVPPTYQNTKPPPAG